MGKAEKGSPVHTAATEAIASRTGKVRQEASLQGLTSVQAYDGKEGWQIQPQAQLVHQRLDPGDVSAVKRRGL